MSEQSGNLTSDETLRHTAEAVLVTMRARSRDWYAALRQHLERVHAATPTDLADRAFLEKLWEDDGISATGMGSVKVAPALDDPGFRQWFATAYGEPLPVDPAAAEAHLLWLYKETEKRLRNKCDRVARLKLNRVLCTRFPSHFTTIADVGRLLFLHRAMGGSAQAHPVTAHLAIKQRLDRLLGPVDTSVSNADLDRLFLPWALYQHLERESEPSPEPEGVTEVAATPSADSLQPLAAALRRKGLTAVKGYFATILEMLPLLAEGMSRQEFYDEVHRSYPSLGNYSINGVINSIAREMNLCVRDDGIYRLNARGLNLLSTRDPDEIADHLLTRVLGVDHAVKALAAGPRPLADLVRHIKAVNPGWTSDVIPRAIVSWLSSMDVIGTDAQYWCMLTERGLTWAARVTWTPEALSAQSAGVLAEPLPQQRATMVAPPFDAVRARLDAINASQLHFPAELVRQLHAGLWSHPVRHFAVLTGISGSGKTQLALNYGRAIAPAGDEANEHVRVIPVQPAWYDPAPLLGFVSPLTQHYCLTPFLEILLRAAADPERPYVVILDEMNLSHPEQYLAPLLSAMETRGWIDLHDLAENAGDVPQRVQYPANLVLIGTLNMDETTHGLSDKILDRAFTLEFWDIDLGRFPKWEEFGLPAHLREASRNVLTALAKALSPVRLHFAWRTIEDVLRYLECATAAGADATSAMDEVVYARVLPKLRGENTARFQKALQDTLAVLNAHDLKRCAGKVESLLADLRETGTARFWR
jgi:hypothetical protein